MEHTTCPLCGVEYDDNGVCAVTCMALVTFEDDQARAEAYEIQDRLGHVELTDEEKEIDRDLVALILFNIRSRQTYRR